MALDQLIPEKEPKFKWWHILLILFIGLSMFIFGVFLKIVSYPWADLCIAVASFTFIFCCFLGIIKLIFFRSKNSRL